MDMEETRIRPSSVTDFYSNEGTFTAIKVMQFSKLGMKGVLSVSRRYMKGVTFL